MSVAGGMPPVKSACGEGCRARGPPAGATAADGVLPAPLGNAGGPIGAGPPDQPCPSATPVPAARAATDAKNPFLIERSLGCGPSAVVAPRLVARADRPLLTADSVRGPLLVAVPVCLAGA